MPNTRLIRITLDNNFDLFGLSQQQEDFIAQIPKLIDDFQGVQGPPGEQGIQGEQGEQGLPGTLITPNYAGHVTANIEGVSFTGTTWPNGSGAFRTFNLSTANVTISDNTKWPINAQIPIIVNNKLKENTINGQAHKWRFTVAYSGLAQGQQYSIKAKLYNPNSTFQLFGNDFIYTITNQTSGELTFEFDTIADNISIPDGEGYLLDFTVIFNSYPQNAIWSLTKILRISYGVENGILS